MDKLISNVICSKNLFELADNLECLIKNARTIRKRKLVIDELRRQVNVLAFYAKVRTLDRGHLVYDEEKSILLYLDNYWPLNRTCNEDIRCLESIIERIRTNILPSTATRLSIETIYDLMSLTERKFSFCSKLLRDKPIRILLLNHMHTEWNCYYSATITSDIITKEYIMMTTPKIDCPQEYSFLHELGHVLHTRITKKLFCPPESFQIICDGFLKKEDNISSRELCEIFADFFAIAVLYLSEFENCIPYINFSDYDKEMLGRYYACIIDSSD